MYSEMENCAVGGCEFSTFYRRQDSVCLELSVINAPDDLILAIKSSNWQQETKPQRREIQRRQIQRTFRPIPEAIWNKTPWEAP